MRKNYVIGLDVGENSVGLAAIEMDESSDEVFSCYPLRLLNCQSVIHDGSLDPSGQKAGESRKSVSGVARRTRRLHERRRKRLNRLDQVLEELGFPVKQAKLLVSPEGQAENKDPYLPWHARILAVSEYIENDNERKLAIAVAARHIARHRGWRNPYSSFSSLEKSSATASPFYMNFLQQQQRVLLHAKHKGLPTGSDDENLTGNHLLPDVHFEYASESAADEFKGSNIADHAFDKRKVKVVGLPHWDQLESAQDRRTLAQLVEPFLNNDKNSKLRRNRQGVNNDCFPLINKLHQSDSYFEINRILETQKIPKDMGRRILEAVFHQINPKDIGAAAELIGQDELDSTQLRACKASPEYQKFVILNVINNLRIKEAGETRDLGEEEKRSLLEFLTSEEACDMGSDLSWHDVAERLGIERPALSGAGGMLDDGTPVSSKRPPSITTEYIIKEFAKKNNIPVLSEWWDVADAASREALVEFLGNTGKPPAMDEEQLAAWGEVELFAAQLGELDESALAKLDDLSLPSGRASYSTRTLKRLNDFMVEENCNSAHALKEIFGKDGDWSPAANPLGSPTGNPSVDRTIKIIARWLKACERKWGAPAAISIEHVRDGFKSVKQRREIQREQNRRFLVNEEIREKIRADRAAAHLGSDEDFDTRVSYAAIRKEMAIQRQNGRCLYCGNEINFSSAEMDHIVPRSGPGCSNEISNLAAVCRSCNSSKGKELFFEWNEKEKRESGVDHLAISNEIIDEMHQDSVYPTRKALENFKRDVKARLRQRNEDEPMDNRSAESTAWMARELREQIQGYFGSEVLVKTYRGSITSEARRASGLEKALPWLGGASRKTRLDRRHHAIDASVIALLRPNVAQTLSEREAIRKTQQMSDAVISRESKEHWINYPNTESNARYEQIKLFERWRDQMERLRDLLSDAMELNKVIVSEPLRLSLKIGKLHDDTIHKMTKGKLSDAYSCEAIDKAETPELWRALTSLPEFDEEKGLPENPNRRIWLNGAEFGADSIIGFMCPSKEDLDSRNTNGKAAIRVRNGYAEIGDTIHHSRIYLVKEGNRFTYCQLRVYAVDLFPFARRDLFNVELGQESISVRTAVPKLRKALREGSAVYLGWIVANDELRIDRNSKLFMPSKENKINKLMLAFPTINTMRIVGFDTNARLKVKPVSLAAEGLPDIDWGNPTHCNQVVKVYGDYDWKEKDIREINSVIKDGCPLAIDKVMNSFPIVIRRSTLGYERWCSSNHMPLCWKVPNSGEIGL